MSTRPFNSILFGILWVLMSSALLSSASAQTSSSTSDPAWVEEGKQLFLAQIQLQAYRDELDKYGAGQAMGLGDMLGEKSLTRSDGFLTDFEQSLRLTAFNTFNYGRLLFTNEEQQDLQQWTSQCEALDNAIAGLRTVYGIMDEQGVRLEEAFQIAETDSRYTLARSWTQTVAQSPWAHEVLSGVELPKHPIVPSDFGIDLKINFVDENWKTFLTGQISIANFYVFWRGDAMISALGETKLGTAIMQTLRLNQLAAKVATLPDVIQKPALWMIYETADGCMIRYFYAAYLGLSQLKQQKTMRITGSIPK